MAALPSTEPPPTVARGRAPERRLGRATAGAAGAAALLAAAFAYPHLPDPGPLCPLRRLTGVPCPGCGMTTGVVATVRGDVLDGFGANPVAPLLVALAVATVIWWVAGRVLRRDLVSSPAARASRLVGRVHPVAIVPVVGALWLFELHRFGEL